MSITSGIILTVATASFAFAQSSPRVEFEVASIRPTSTEQGQVNVGLHIDGAQVRIAALTLKDYLAMAYRTKASRISGPDWISSDRFDIAATIPAGSNGQVPEMLQSLLADRFQLKFHKEQREFPVYALVRGKGPLKLKEIPPDDSSDAAPKPVNIAAGGSAAGVNIDLGNGSSISFVPNRLEAKKLTMEVFASSLERFADRPIVDMTGLKSQYDLSFDINPEDYQPMLIRSAVYAGVTLPPQALRLIEGNSSASLSDALQQVGLKLDPRKAPLDVIVVDDARRTPTDN